MLEADSGSSVYSLYYIHSSREAPEPPVPGVNSYRLFSSCLEKGSLCSRHIISKASFYHRTTSTSTKNEQHRCQAVIATAISDEGGSLLHHF